jgi:hypothetical protein
MNLIHPQHPPAGVPATVMPGGSISERRKGQFLSGGISSISDTYRDHVYVTPSGMLNLRHFEFIHKVLGAERIVHSVDYPYLTQVGARDFLQGLQIGQEEREKIAHGNAEMLLQI